MASERQHHDPIDWLRAEYQTRRRSNSAYSLRAFARFLKVSSGSLSEILSRKRAISSKQAQKIAGQLALTPDETEIFLRVCGSTRNVGTKTHGTGKSLAAAKFRELERDEFALVSEWYHFAILSLMETKTFRSDPAWIARRLAISSTEVRSALERLDRLKYIKLTEAGYVLATGPLTTTTDVPSAALRRLHKQSLTHVIDSMDAVDVRDRDVTSMTIAVNKEKFAIAKELIRNFRRNLSDFLETGERDEVYHLNIQLMPVSGVKL